MITDQLQHLLARLPYPALDAVADLRVATGRDSTGDPAVWVFVIDRDGAIERLWSYWDDLRAQIRGVATEETSPDTTTYVRLQALSEVSEEGATRRRALSGALGVGMEGATRCPGRSSGHAGRDVGVLL